MLLQQIAIESIELFTAIAVVNVVIAVNHQRLYVPFCCRIPLLTPIGAPGFREHKICFGIAGPTSAVPVSREKVAQDRCFTFRSPMGLTQL